MTELCIVSLRENMGDIVGEFLPPNKAPNFNRDKFLVLRNVLTVWYTEGGAPNLGLGHVPAGFISYERGGEALTILPWVSAVLQATVVRAEDGHPVFELYGAALRAYREAKGEV